MRAGILRLCNHHFTIKTGIRYMSGGNVGFIGLGNMGSNMAQHLLNKGKKLVVYDISKQAVEAFTKQGATAASNPADLARQCSHVFTMVPTSAHVMDVYNGKNGILEAVNSGTYLMDSSTIDPETSRTVAQLAQKKGAIFLDTPVAGAVPAAKAGTLTFMVGGKAEDVKKIEPLLMCMGKNVVHCGDTGLGEAAKICNNMMLAISMVGTSETLNLARNLGLSPELITKILNISSGRTWVSEIYHPVPGVMESSPASRNYEGGFFTQLIAKDLRLAQNCASQTDSSIPLGSIAHQIYNIMVKNGFYGKDFSVVYQFLKEKKE